MAGRTGDGSCGRRSCVGGCVVEKESCVDAVEPRLKFGGCRWGQGSGNGARSVSQNQLRCVQVGGLQVAGHDRERGSDIKTSGATWVLRKR